TEARGGFIDIRGRFDRAKNGADHRFLGRLSRARETQSTQTSTPPLPNVSRIFATNRTARPSVGQSCTAHVAPTDGLMWINSASFVLMLGMSPVHSRLHSMNVRLCDLVPNNTIRHNRDGSRR